MTKTAAKKLPQTIYMDAAHSQKLRLAARILHKPISGFIEDLVVEWLDRNGKALSQAEDALTKIQWKK
jgi:hypothetical protein